jgi:hypothetical protein
MITQCCVVYKSCSQGRNSNNNSAVRLGNERAVEDETKMVRWVPILYVGSDIFNFFSLPPGYLAR